ncbi:MAG: lysine-2,3-aminomutase-like protein [Bauldia sp.]|nr:lysine-2,3-aminomutase-like protein [Bauldia sp.]
MLKNRPSSPLPDQPLSDQLRDAAPSPRRGEGWGEEAPRLPDETRLALAERAATVAGVGSTLVVTPAAAAIRASTSQDGAEPPHPNPPPAGERGRVALPASNPGAGKATLRSAQDLADAALIPSEEVKALSAVAARYAVAVTPDMGSLIEAEPEGPIAAQFIPDARELTSTPEELLDPIGDEAHAPVKGIVHRYPDRVLLKPLHVCAVYCRFCFRREVVGPGGSGALSPAELDAALGYVRAHPEVWEVILTGGDPFMLSPRRMREIGRTLAGIGHVKVVRWHTRVPVVDPSRVTGELVAALKASGKAVWVAIHANHASEFTAEARDAIARLAEAGIPLVSQSVLLRGVNDDVATLDALMRTFVENRVKPYYLHHPDLAPGTAHFRGTIAEGQGLMRDLRGRLSGLAQPTYVLDIPGGHGKVPVGPAWVEDDAEGLVVTDPNGEHHRYG